MRTPDTSVTAALARFLSPQVWKQAHRQHAPKKTASRWHVHARVMVVLLMNWVTGDSEAERCATARAYYVACYQHGKRPGASLPGFQRALAPLPLPVLHALFAAVRPAVAAAAGRNHDGPRSGPGAVAATLVSAAVGPGAGGRRGPQSPAAVAATQGS